MTYRTRKSTLSLTTVFLLPVMRGLNKRPPPPPSKLLEKCKAPGGLNSGFMVPFERMRNVNTTLKNGDDFFFSSTKKRQKKDSWTSLSRNTTRKRWIIVESWKGRCVKILYPVPGSCSRFIQRTWLSRSLRRADVLPDVCCLQANSLGAGNRLENIWLFYTLAARTM